MLIFGGLEREVKSDRGQVVEFDEEMNFVGLKRIQEMTYAGRVLTPNPVLLKNQVYVIVGIDQVVKPILVFNGKNWSEA